MKNIIFFLFGIFVFYGLVHDFFGNSDFIATISTIILLIILYYSVKRKLNNPSKDIFEIMDETGFKRNQPNQKNEFEVPEGYKSWEEYYEKKYKN